MRLAISNIAWPADREPEVADRLAAFAVAGIEIAPTKVWPSPLSAPASAVAEYRRFWETRGLPIVALQSLLFEKPALRIFEQPRIAMEYLCGMIDLGGRLGASALVFGSPKNRLVSPRSAADVRREAIEFFRTLGDRAIAANTCLCIEPNPTAYGCDFLTTAGEAQHLVETIDHPGVRLHLDSACLALACDDAGPAVFAAGSLLRHYHVSEPNLAPVGGASFDHRPFGDALRNAGYDRWISIEMKTPESFSIDCLERACETARAHYS